MIVTVDRCLRRSRVALVDLAVLGGVDRVLRPRHLEARRCSGDVALACVRPTTEGTVDLRLAGRHDDRDRRALGLLRAGRRVGADDLARRDGVAGLAGGRVGSRRLSSSAGGVGRGRPATSGPATVGGPFDTVSVTVRVLRGVGVRRRVLVGDLVDLRAVGVRGASPRGPLNPAAVERRPWRRRRWPTTSGTVTLSAPALTVERDRAALGHLLARAPGSRSTTLPLVDVVVGLRRAT